jgi:hypothetical protein
MVFLRNLLRSFNMNLLDIDDREANDAKQTRAPDDDSDRTIIILKETLSAVIVFISNPFDHFTLFYLYIIISSKVHCRVLKK